MTEKERGVENIDRDLLRIFSDGVVDGDPSSGFELARLFWGSLPSSEVGLYLAVLEALIIQSAKLGSSDAQEYLSTMWPDMKAVLHRRLLQRGFTDDLKCNEQ
jgi:hypothetical protein